MDILALLGTATGIALFSGLRLYTTILVFAFLARKIVHLLIGRFRRPWGDMNAPS